MLWFAPVLLLGIAGVWPFLRRHRWEGLSFLLIIGAYLLGYSRYLYWSGGVTYGPRYMLPVAAFLVLLAAPVFAWLTGERRAPARTPADDAASAPFDGRARLAEDPGRAC